MTKKQSRSASKAAAKPALKLRKVTVRDLSAKKAGEPLGGSGSYTITQRTR